MIISFCGDFLPKYPVKFNNTSIFIGNLECAFSEQEIKSYKAYSCILPLDNMENINGCNFAALSLANNHSNDANNFNITYKILKEKYPNIQFFGTKEKPFAVFEDVAIIGCLEKSRSRCKYIFKEEDVVNLITDLKNKHKQIYVYPHWGKEGEYTRYPSPAQIKLAHKWIDCGATGIFGSHSHVFQGKEIYKNKPIYYSLGNFFFPHEESKLYPNTDTNIVVSVEENNIKEQFYKFNEDKIEEDDYESNRNIFNSISEQIKNLNYWKWANLIGSFYLTKNTKSWKIRLKKNFAKTFPLFCVWNLLPKTILFRIAKTFGNKK